MKNINILTKKDKQIRIMNENNLGKFALFFFGIKTVIIKIVPHFSSI